MRPLSRRTALRPALGLALWIALSGCSQVLGQLRRDLNDEQGLHGPTVGGAFPEAGYLEDERYLGSRGTRSPASSREEPYLQSDVEERGAAVEPGLGGSESESLEDQRSQRPSRAPRRLTKNDFIDQAVDSGSLWSSGGEANFFFSKNRARSPGDIIAISVESEMLRDIASEIKRTLTSGERRRELDLLEFGRAQPGAAESAPARADGGTAANAPTDTSYSAVDLVPVIGVKSGDSFLAEIVERFPNGNYRIRGSKRIPYRNTTKLMTVMGIVRGADLGADETISSGKIYEYRLEAIR